MNSKRGQKQFTEEETQMANKFIKQMLNYFRIRKMPI